MTKGLILFPYTEGMWLGMENPSAATCTGSNCDLLFEWTDASRTKVTAMGGETWTTSPVSDGSECIILNEDGLKTVPCTDEYPSLCQFQCGKGGGGGIYDHLYARADNDNLSGPGQKDENAEKNCVAVEKNGPDHQFTVEKCDELAHFICEKGKKSSCKKQFNVHIRSC